MCPANGRFVGIFVYFYTCLSDSNGIPNGVYFLRDYSSLKIGSTLEISKKIPLRFECTTPARNNVPAWQSGKVSLITKYCVKGQLAKVSHRTR